MKRHLLTFIFLAQGAFAGDLYLDAAASGANSGTSWADAWEDTTDVDWNDISSGDTLWIQGGVYSLLGVSGETGITIQIAADATEQAVFSGGSSYLSNFDSSTIDGLLDGSPMFNFTGATGAYPSANTILSVKWSQVITIRGIEVGRESLMDSDGGQIIGIGVSNSSAPSNEDVIIEDCYIHHVTGDAININNPGPTAGYGEYIIRRCTVKHTGDDAVQASGNMTVNDCYFDKDGQAPLFGGHQDGVQSAIGASYIKLYNNTILGYSQCLFVEHPASYVLVYNNILIGGETSGSQRGIVAGVHDTIPFSGDYLVANNICYNFITYYGAQHGSLAASEDGNQYFGNNVYVNCKYMVAGDSILDSSNIYWDVPGVQYYDGSGNPVSTPGDRDSGSARNVDPGFNDAPGGDFSFIEYTQPIEAEKTFEAFFTTDQDGNSRGATWYVGALQDLAVGLPKQHAGPTGRPPSIGITGGPTTMSSGYSIGN